MIRWWVSFGNPRITACVDVDDGGRVIEAPRVLKKFMGKDIRRLMGWMASVKGGYEMTEMEVE